MNRLQAAQAFQVISIRKLSNTMYNVWCMRRFLDESCTLFAVMQFTFYSNLLPLPSPVAFYLGYLPFFVYGAPLCVNLTNKSAR